MKTRRKVITSYLEMTDSAQRRPAGAPAVGCEVRRAEIPSPELSRFLYAGVGGDWYWTDRLDWTYDRWRTYLEREGLETWVAYVSGTPAGYYELEAQPGSQVQIVYFGLLPHFTGQGLGGYLLSRAVERAWAMGASRIWVHTCSLDHPGALANYLARGFRIYREEKTVLRLPGRPPGPWPGARGR